MGEFVVQIDGAEPLVLRNQVAREGMRRVYRQLFPAFEGTITFALGIAGPDTAPRTGRPQLTGGGVVLSPPTLSWGHCTDDANSNEGGGATAAMRAWLGYARAAPAFESGHDGVFWTSAPAVFQNTLAWTPQPASNWIVPGAEEQRIPPPWLWRRPPEPDVGFPWHAPRVHPSTVPAGMEWLTDYRKAGGFPVTIVFLGDGAGHYLLAYARLPGIVHLWPGSQLRVGYRGRLWSPTPHVTKAFMRRFVRYVWEQAGARYSAWYVRPVLSTLEAVTRDTTYADVAPHFRAGINAVALPTWTCAWLYASGVTSSATPAWTNSTGGTLTFAWLAVWGIADGVEELAWMVPIAPPAVVANGDTLRVPGKIQFSIGDGE